MTTDICTNAFGDRYLKAIGSGIFDQAPADQLFAKYLDPNLFNPDCLHIMVGSDSGLLIDFIQRQPPPPGSSYLFIEPEPVLSAVQSLAPGIQGAGNMALCAPENWVSAAVPLQLETYILKKSVLIHPCLSSKRAAQTLYQPIIDRIFQELDQTAYSVKEPLSAGEKIDANLANLSENRVPLQNLYDHFPGRSAIVLGAGPSLDHHLEWIRQHRDRLYIIAASRLCKRLQEEDLPPDMVVSVDWQEINYEQSKGLLDLPTDTLLVHSSQVSPQLVAQWPGPHVFMGKRLPWMSALNDPDNDYTGGPTVSNGALYIGGKMGFTTILLSGVDLCTPDGSSSHAGGLFLDKNNSFTNRVETYNGCAAKTNNHMLHAAQILSAQAREIKGAKVINLSGAAVKLDGIEHRECREIELSANAGKDWKQVSIADTAELRLAHNQRMLEEVQRVDKDTKKLLELVKKAKKLNQSMHKRDHTGSFNLQAKNKLNNLKQKMEADFEYLMPTIRELGINASIAAMTTRDINQFSDKELEKLNYRYYHAFEVGAFALQEMLGKCRQRLQSRILEDEPNPDLEKLLNQWREDKQVGRSLFWKRKHLSTQLSESERALLETAGEEFQILHLGVGLVYPLPDTAWYIREHIQSAYNRGQLKHLEDLNIYDIEKQLTRLDYTHLSEERARQIRSLASFFVASLRESPDIALRHFQSINPVDYTEPVLVAALSSAYAKNDASVISQCFSKLIGFDRRYLPQYAEWLLSNNQIIEAIHAFTGYLQHAPADLNVWLRLGEVYQKMGESELATMAYEFVSQLDPGNEIAAQFFQQQSTT